MNKLSGNPADGRDGRYAIVAGRFNQVITDKLIAGAEGEFGRHTSPTPNNWNNGSEKHE